MWHAICSSIPCDKTTDGLAQSTDQQRQAATTPTPAKNCRPGRQLHRWGAAITGSCGVNAAISCWDSIRRGMRGLEADAAKELLCSEESV